MLRLKLVIFDLDGTLVNAYPAITESFNYTMRKFGYPELASSVIRSGVGWGDRNLLKPFLKAKDLKKALFVYRAHHRKALLEGARLFPGVIKVLRRLRARGYKLSVASNRPSEFSLILIKKLGLKRYFDYILCADKVRYGKPHPEILSKIRKKFIFKPREALFVGDMALDIKAGKRAGMKTIAVTTGSSTLSEIRNVKPDMIIGKITGLEGRL